MSQADLVQAQGLGVYGPYLPDEKAVRRRVLLPRRIMVKDASPGMRRAFLQK
jgi:hypothetical protein